jgi:uncharacterized membrane protein
MIDIELKDIDPEDLEDLIIKIESSFGIFYEDQELAHIKTFGGLCDNIKGKIKLDKKDDCTTQQAFYKLKDALTNTVTINSLEITPKAKLNKIFPRKNRISNIKLLEKNIGFKLNILEARDYIIITLLILFTVSLIGFFFDWKIPLIGIITSIFGFWLSGKTGKEFCIDTVGELAEKMTQENYLKARRNSNTFNENEIEKLITDFFSNSLHLDKSKLNRDSLIP